MLRHIGILKSLPTYSSVKSTWSQSLSVQLTWNCAQFRRACLWCRVMGIWMHALLDRRPLCQRLLWTVCVEMLTPSAFLNSFHRVVAFTKGWCLACTTRNRLWIGVVASLSTTSMTLGSWVRRLDVIPCSGCHTLAHTEDYGNPCCEDRHSSMPTTTMDNSSVVNRRRWRCRGIQDLKCGKMRQIVFLETDAKLSITRVRRNCLRKPEYGFSGSTCIPWAQTQWGLLKRVIGVLEWLSI